jgi:hypothetical protein
MTLNANSNPAYVAIQAFLGVADESHQTAVDFQSASTLTGAAIVKQTINLPGLLTTSVSLTTLFANCVSPQFFCAYDITTSPGQNFGINNSGGSSLANFFMVAANSAWGYACDGNPLPATIYLYNPNAAAGVVQLACITN